MAGNPFSLTFGKEPKCNVKRRLQFEEIIEDFKAESPVNQVYIITGVRGQGKTVMMTSIQKYFENESDWIVINLNPERDLLNGLAANLYEHKMLKTEFTELNLSAFGIGLGIKNEAPISDIEVALHKMLAIVMKKKKRVLIAIDEVTNSQRMREFTSAFQIMVRQDFPVFLVMTGLFQNIRSLQDEKSLTFLYRAPRIELKPLGVKAMANSYEKSLNISETEATKLAAFTKGYPFAFQVVGYLLYDTDNKLEDVVSDFDEYMEQKAYEKIWSELSEGDKEILRVMSVNGRMKTQEIIENTRFNSSTYSTYRRRLVNKGIIITKDYGYAELALPRFDVFIQNYEM